MMLDQVTLLRGCGQGRIQCVLCVCVCVCVYTHCSSRWSVNVEGSIHALGRLVLLSPVLACSRLSLKLLNAQD